MASFDDESGITNWNDFGYSIDTFKFDGLDTTLVVFEYWSCKLEWY